MGLSEMKNAFRLGVVLHIYNLNYRGGGDRRTRLPQGKVSERLYL